MTGAAASYILGIIFALLTHVHCIHDAAVTICYGLVLLGQIAYILFAVKQAAVPFFKSLFQPTKALLDARSPVMSRDAQIWDCVQKFDPDDLEYAGRRLTLEAKQARKRIGLISPRLEKLGIIPALTAAILSGYKSVDAFQKTGWKLPPNIFLYICVAICLINFGAIPLLTGTDRFDQLADLLKFAAAIKRGKTMDDERDSDKQDDEEDDEEGNADKDDDGNKNPNENAAEY